MRKLAFFSAAILLAGCASLPPRTVTKPIEAKQLWERLWENQARKREVTRSIQGKIRLEMTAEKQSLSGTGIFYSVPEGLRLELRDPLGRTQYTAVLKGNKVFAAYYPSQKRVYFDRRQGAAYLRDFLGLGINFYDLKELWLGILPFSKKDAKLESVSDAQAENQGLAVLKSGNIEIEANINADSGEIISLRWKEADVLAHFEFSEFARCCEEQVSQNELPRIGHGVLLTIENRKSELDLEWEELLPVSKKAAEVFNLKIPRETKKVLLK